LLGWNEEEQLSITQPTYYRWRKGYGGTRMEQVKCLKELV
jgi:hypothetical protein